MEMRCECILGGVCRRDLRLWGSSCEESVSFSLIFVLQHQKIFSITLL